MLEVKLYDASGKVTAEFNQESNTDVDFVSLVNSETYGPPPLIAPAPGRAGDGPRAAIEDRVLFINTRLVPAFQIVRISD